MIAEAPPTHWWEKIGELMTEQVRQDERICGLEDWESKQNGALERMQSRFDSFCDKFDRFKTWVYVGIIGFLVSAVTSLLLILLRVLPEVSKAMDIAMNTP